MIKKNNKLEKLAKKYGSFDKLKEMYMTCKINFGSRELQYVLDNCQIKGHGGANFYEKK